jgi:hypothetical protein
MMIDASKPPGLTGSARSTALAGQHFYQIL